MSSSFTSAQGSLEKPDTSPESPDIHRGAIDQTTITTQPPFKVMERVKALLQNMGVHIQEESAFRYRCIREKKTSSPTAEDADSNISVGALSGEALAASPGVLYGSHSEDPADEVRFSVELTRLSGLNDTYSLDIRRLKGNLRSYKFIYDTIRDRAELNRD